MSRYWRLVQQKWWHCAYRPRRSTVIVLGLYILFTLAITFPFIMHPNRTLVAPLDGDVAGSIAKYEAIVHAHANPFTTAHLNNISYPVGMQVNLGVDRVSFFSELYLWIGSLVVGPIAAHSLESILGFVLTAFVTFLFVRRVIGSVPAAALAGLIFGFSPHMLSLARAEPTYTHMWLLLLPLWAFWNLAVRGISRKRVALSALSVVPAIFWTPYFALHVMLVGGSGLLGSLFLWRRKYSVERLFLTTAFISAVWLVALATYWYVGTHTASSQVPDRTTLEAYQQAAHPLMYVFPGVYSLWGQGLNHWLAHHVVQAAGTNLYVGMSTIILALVAVVYVFVHRHEKKVPYDQPKVQAATLIAGLVVVVCFAFSLAPRVHLFGLAIPTPNDLVIHAVPSLRAGQRLVMPILGGLAVLAGIGSYIVVQQFGPKLRIGIAVALIMIVGLDLWALPPRTATTVPIYPSLAVLRQQPTAPTAQYTSNALMAYPEQLPCVLQDQHGQPLVNDCSIGRPAQETFIPPVHLKSIQELPFCEQPDVLQSQHVRYLIVNRVAVKLLACFKTAQQPPRLISSDSTYLVFDITHYQQ